MSKMLSPNFFIGELKIGSIEGASCLNMGNNWPTDFKNYKKHNQGFGSVGGDNNEFSDAKAFLYDPDILDMVNDAEGSIPDWIKEIIVKEQAQKNNDQ